VHGRLDVVCVNAAENNFRRTIRQAVVSTKVGVAERWVKQIFLFDPVFLHTIGDGFILRGIQLRSVAEGVYEHEQMWLCLTTWKGQLPAGIVVRLPETGAPK